MGVVEVDGTSTAKFSKRSSNGTSTVLLEASDLFCGFLLLPLLENPFTASGWAYCTE